MSGGAFDYACFKIGDDLDNIAGKAIPQILEWMKTNEVSPDAMRIIRTFAAQAAGLADFASKIQPLLYAIEWQASNDSAEIDKEVAKLKADNDFWGKVAQHPQGIG